MINQTTIEVKGVGVFNAVRVKTTHKASRSKEVEGNFNECEFINSAEKWKKFNSYFDESTISECTGYLKGETVLVEVFEHYSDWRGNSTRIEEYFTIPATEFPVEIFD